MSKVPCTKLEKASNFLQFVPNRINFRVVKHILDGILSNESVGIKKSLTEIRVNIIPISCRAVLLCLVSNSISTVLCWPRLPVSCPLSLVTLVTRWGKPGTRLPLPVPRDPRVLLLPVWGLRDLLEVTGDVLAMLVMTDVTHTLDWLWLARTTDRPVSSVGSDTWLWYWSTSGSGGWYYIHSCHTGPYTKYHIKLALSCFKNQ